MQRSRNILRIAIAFVPAILLAATGSDVVSLTPAALVRKTVEHEAAASQSSSVNHMFVSRKQTAHGSQTRLYVETTQAMAGMTIAYDDKPLSADQQKSEQDRLENLIHDPAELEKKRAKEKEDAERVRRIVRAMPDAFLFEDDGTEPGRSGLGKPGDQLVRLKFRPNPKYEPPTRVEEILTGMEGVLLIDPKQLRIARIDGTLFKEVGFGWGILGHLDKGGRFFVEQQDLADGTWDASRMTLRFTGKILLFKHLDIQSDEIYRDYRPVPSNLTFAQGVEMLKKQDRTEANNSPAAQTRGQSAGSASK
jgi:putative ubiquitin-RnfH superfamily antitoxin RatB of RatAB toxin-antitoxin module